MITKNLNCPGCKGKNIKVVCYGVSTLYKNRNEPISLIPYEIRIYQCKDCKECFTEEEKDVLGF